jgi:hypothetical protein
MADFDQEVGEQHVSEALPSLLPTSAPARMELLTNVNSLREVCEEYYTCLAAGAGSSIGLRVAGRVIAGIHRELSLRVPDEDDLYSAMMPYTSGGTFSLDRKSFVAFVENVLVHCLQGIALGDDSHSSLHVDQDANSTEMQPRAPVGAITVHAYKLDGTSATSTIDDSQTTEMLQQQVEEKLGVPKILQRLLLNTLVLEPGQPLFGQGVADGSTITVTRCKPQATLLRIRPVNLGDDVRSACKQPETVSRWPEDAYAALRLEPYSHKTTQLVPKPMQCTHSLQRIPKPDGKHERRHAPDVRIRRVNLGRH